MAEELLLAGGGGAGGNSGFEVPEAVLNSFVNLKKTRKIICEVNY